MTYQQILQQVGYPEKALILDFETYFDQNYSLSKMSTIEYIMDSHFDFTGCGFQVLSADPLPIFVPKPRLNNLISGLQQKYGFNLERCTVVAKNCKFDITILAVKFDIIPPYIIDIDDLLRYYDARMSHKMKDVAPMFGLQDKGDANQFKGLHYEEMDQNIRATLENYCKGDVEIETTLFKILLPKLTNPVVELPVARHTLDLYLRPRIQFDFKAAGKLKAEMLIELDRIVNTVGFTDKELSSPLKFVKILQNALPENQQVPVKPGKPGKNMVKLLGQPGVIPAFAKDDTGFQELLVHSDEKIRNLCLARQAVKSWPLHIKRIDNMANQADASGGLLRVPLNYYGGHTGRWSGGEKINLQNLGGRGRAGQGTHPLIQQMRNLLCAPDGNILGIADSAQIEARILAWLAGQDDLIKGFADGEDIYSVFATKLFNSCVYKPREDEFLSLKHLLKIRRGFGKDAILGCIAVGTPVLTNTGWKKIEHITKIDRLWDGKQWVENAGIANKGKRVCVNVNGVWLTPEHEVINNYQWYQAVHLVTNNQVSGIDTGSLQLQKLNLESEVGLSPSNVVAPVVESLLRQETIWSQENLHAVMSVLKSSLVELRRLCPNFWMSQDMKDWLREFVISLNVAIIINAGHITDMVDVVLRFGISGSKIEQLLLDTLCHCLDGIIPNSKLIVLTTIKDTNRAISDLLRGDSKLKTQNVICYDILNVGPNKRFQAGNLLGSNCGYGMGTNTFYQRCIANADLRPLFDSGAYNWNFIDNLIRTYRITYKRIPEFWKAVEKAFKWVIKYPHEQMGVSYRYQEPADMSGRNFFGHNLPLLGFWNDNGTVHIGLPSGRELLYRHCALKQTTKGSQIRWHWGHLWGGSITENIVQAVARDLLAWWILEMEKANLPVVLHSHDEIICMLQKNDVYGLDDMLKIMRTGPDWTEGLPLDVSDYCLAKVYQK